MATAPLALDPKIAPMKPASRLLFWAGLILLLTGLGLLVLLFAPVIEEELRYERKIQSERGASPQGAIDSSPGSMVSAEPAEATPVDEQFGIVIPKIGANAKVIPEVDWRDARIYQEALRQGVAHAAGSAVPGTSGNVFLFAHSGEGLLQAARYNAVFYLLAKLEPGDDIEVYYEGKRYRYEVTQLKRVASDAVEYVQVGPSPETLTLMTCWPAGTTWKRLIVQAKLHQEDNL